MRDSVNSPAALSSQYIESRNRVLKALILLFLVATVGTVGYYLIEDWPLLDAFYMTVITLSTVGYGETHALDTQGRIFSIFLIITSFGIVGYGVSNLAAFMIEGEFQRYLQGRKMDKRIAEMSDHIILCGAGHNGKCIAEELYKTSTPFVLIERDEEEMAHILQIGDIPYVQSDATEDEALRLAGIKRAKGLITALSDDKDNTFVVLSARSLNPNLRIIARNIDIENSGKLRKAGADEVISPNTIGGMRMASTMIRPTVVRFLDAMLKDENSTIRFEEIHVDTIPSLIDTTLARSDVIKKTGLLVMAIVHEGREYDFNPRDDSRIKAGDIILVMGSRDQIKKLQSV